MKPMIEKIAATLEVAKYDVQSLKIVRSSISELMRLPDLPAEVLPFIYRMMNHVDKALAGPTSLGENRDSYRRRHIVLSQDIAERLLA